MNPIDDAMDDLVTHARAWASALRLAGNMSAEPLAKIWIGQVDAFIDGISEVRPAEDRIRAFGQALPFLKAALDALESREAEADSEDAGYWLHEMLVLDRAEALLMPRLAHEFTLNDWRAGEALDAGDPAMAEPVTLSVGMNGSYLDIKAPDGRMISIELEADQLRVMSYNAVKDEPLTVEIPVSDEISVEDREYRAGVRLPPEDKECIEEASMAPGA